MARHHDRDKDGLADQVNDTSVCCDGEDRDDPMAWDNVTDEPDIPPAEGEGLVFDTGQETED